MLGFLLKWPRGHNQDSHPWMCHKNQMCKFSSLAMGLRGGPWRLSPGLWSPGLVHSLVPTTLNQTLQEANSLPRKDPRDLTHTNQLHGHSSCPGQAHVLSEWGYLSLPKFLRKPCCLIINNKQLESGNITDMHETSIGENDPFWTQSSSAICFSLKSTILY